MNITTIKILEISLPFISFMKTISIYDKYKKDWAKIADEISKIIDINDNKSINIVYETLSEKANIIINSIIR